MEKRSFIRFVGPAVLARLLFAVALYAGESAAPKVVVSVTTDRADAIYKVKEKATFTIEVKREGQVVQEGTVNYALSLDGVGDLGHDTLKIEGGKASVSGSLDKPGILRCTATYACDEAPRTVGLGGAAYDPFKIEPTAVMPKDFEKFWKAQKAALAKVSMDPQLEAVPQSGEIEAFKITLANVNNSHVYGYFAKPKGAGPYPAILTVPGASVNPVSVGGATSYAAKGFLAMMISVHDVANDLPKEQYEQLKEGRLKGYPTQGREDQKTYYFYRVLLGCVRAVDYLASRPEWDRKHMIINGSSQGGALSLISAGLDPRITALAANVPAMCDHSGRDFGRPSGWPGLVPAGQDGKLDPKVLEVSAYYDAVNFARQIDKKVPAIVGVGLVDTTCPATTVFSAYNVLRGHKQMDIAPLMGHAQSKSYTDLKEQWILKQAGLAK